MRLFEKDGRKMAARTDIQAAAFLADGWEEVVVQPAGSEPESDKDAEQEGELPAGSEPESDKDAEQEGELPAGSEPEGIETSEAPKRGRKPKGA